MTKVRRLICSLTLAFAAVGSANVQPAPAQCAEWPLWNAYVDRFVQKDGRVIDYHGPINYTYSEGQAYSLFFSLVANDRERFDTLLNWTQYNLTEGDLTQRLPAWKWGKRDDGSWGILDRTAASDADMWLAYSLLQAGKLWQEQRYTDLGISVLQRIKKEEVQDIPGLGPMILPGPRGFVHNDIWRVNPSYMKLQHLRAFDVADNSGPWNQIVDNTLNLLRATSPLGFAPDWAAYHVGKGWVPDPDKGPIGSYDAIRVYLWAGMLDNSDPAKRELLHIVSGMHRHLEKNPAPPEKVNVLTGKTEGNSPPGFSAAVLPYLKTLDDKDALKKQLQRMKEKNTGGLVGEAPRYYDQVLALFGWGSLENRYRFDAKGQLIPGWKTDCSP